MEGPAHAAPDAEAAHLGPRADPAHVLVRRLAPLLGVDPAGVRIEPGPSPLARPSAIALGPAPEPGVVAHELAHVAQHANRARTRAPAPDVTAAEREAGGLAAAARAGAPLWRPVAALPAGRTARAGDAAGVAPATAPPDVARLEGQLADLVKVTRRAEVERIAAELADPSTWAWEAVETSLQILEVYDWVTARALAAAQEPEARVRLAHLDDGHHARHPGAAAAALAALRAPDAARFLAEANTPPRANEGNGVNRPTLRSAFHGLQPDRLEPAALRGVLGAMRLVPPADLVALTRGDRRVVFRDLLATIPVGDDAAALEAAIAREQRVERAADDALVREVTAVLTSADAQPARDAMTRLAPLAGAATPAAPGSAAPAAAGPAAAGPAPNAPPAPGDRLRAVIAALDGAGLIDRILDGLPEAERYAGAHAATLRRVLSARPPALTLRRIEGLLSYSWHDWAVRDYEVRYAYLLLRTLSLEAQDAWRVSEGGKWYDRLLDNLPDGMVQSGEYTGVGSEFVTAPGDPAADPKQVDAALSDVADGWAHHHAPIDAQQLARRLLGRTREGRPLTGPQTVEPVRRALARRLDAMGILREVYAKLPEAFLLGEETRQEVLDLTALRDPVQVELHAANLLDTGFLDWVSSREAWTAYQLVRSLPIERQQRFSAADPARWSRMLDALTQEMKASLATTVTTGRGPWPSRADLRRRLQDGRLWDASGDRAAELRALCLLARVSDDARFVFDLSKAHDAYRHPPLRPMVADLGLYDPTATPPRDAYVPERLETRAGITELLRYIDYGNAVQWAIFAVRGWITAQEISLGGRSVHLSDFDLTWLQWAMGGDLGGAVVADRPKDLPRVPGASPWSGGAQPAGANGVSGEVDLGTGAVRLRLSELALSRVNVIRGGASYRTGPVSLKNVAIEADFSDRHYTKPAGMKLHTDSLDVDDFVAAAPSIPGNALAAGHLGVRPFDLEAGATGAEDLAAEVPREGQTIPIPVFSYLLDALANVVAIKGGIPFDYTLVDFALIPLTSGMNLAVTEGTSMAAGALNWGTTKAAGIAVDAAADAAIATPAPLDYLWGLATDGVLRPPRTVTERVKDIAGTLRSFHVHFDRLRIDGLTLGAGTQIASLTLEHVDVGVGLSRPAQLRQLIRSLGIVKGGTAAGPDRDAIQARIDAAQAELDGTKDHPGLAVLEAELERLERKDRWEPGSLSATERARLAELSDALRSEAGATLDIGSIQVGRVSGAVEAEGATVRGVHLEGRLPIAVRGYLADEDLVARFLAGPARPPSAADIAARSDVRLTVASTELLPGRDGAPALRVLADRIPGAADLTMRVEALDPAVDPALRTRLTQARDLVFAIEALRAGPGGKAQSPAVLDEIAAKERQVRELLGVSVGTVTLGAITGGLDPASGAITATVHGVDARDIAGDGFAVQRVQGDLTLGVGGLAGLTGDARALMSRDGLEAAKATLTGHFGANATLTGISTEAGGAGTASVTGLSGDVQLLPDGYRLARLQAAEVKVGTLNLGAEGARVTAREVAVEGFDLRGAEIHLTPEDGLRGVTVASLDIARIRAEALVYDGIDAATGAGVRAEVARGALVGIKVRDLAFATDADGTPHLAVKARLGGVEDLRYGVLRATLDSASRTLKTTIAAGTVAGGGAGAPPVLSADYLQDGRDHRITLDVAALRLLGTEVRTPDGTVVVRTLTLGGHVTDTSKDGTVFDVEVGDVDVGHLRWQAGTARLSGDGTVALRSVHASGSLAPSGEVRVDELEVRDVRATGLRYRDGDVDVALGRFGPGHPGGLTVRRVHLSGLVLGADGKLRPGAHVDVVDARVQFAGRVAAGVKAEGDLHAAAIAVDLYRGDAFAVRLRGLEGDVGVDMDGLHAHAVLDGVDADSIAVGPREIRVGGLHVDEVSLDRLTIANAAKPHPFKLSILESGTLDVHGIDLTARLERWGPKEAHDADQPFKRIVVDRFEIARIDTEGLELELPDDGVRITVPVLPWSSPSATPAPPLTTLHHIKLAGDGAGTGFEYVPGKHGHVSGKATLDSAFVPRLEADVKDHFKGAVELHTGAGSIGFAAAGGTVIDLENPRALMSDPATLGTADRQIVVSELGAARVHVADGRVDVTDAHVDKLRYEAPGVLVEIPTISLPGVVSATKDGGHIPTLEIDDAHLRLVFAALAAAGGGSAAAAPLVLGPDVLRHLLDSLQGDLSLNVLIRLVNLPAWLNNRDLDAPVDLHFSNGKLDYQRLQSGLNRGLRLRMADEKDSGSPVLGALARGMLEFWMNRPAELAVGFHVADVGDPDSMEPPTPVYVPLKTWSLETGEVADATDLHQVRLYRAIHPDASAGSGGPDRIDIDTLELRNILGNLRVESREPIPIDFTRAPVVGRVVLSPGALIGLHLEGGVAGDWRPAARSGTAAPTGLTAVGIEALNIDSVRLDLGGGTSATTGSITITRLEKGRVGFRGHTPTDFEATIRQAVARDIRWHL